MSKQSTTPDFKAYQQAFTQRIRNPAASPVPAQVDPARMAVYESLIFNNLLESVSLCFPVARSVLGQAAWEALVRQYFIHYASNTPIFREIPETFVTFLAGQGAEKPLSPVFLLSLCHYEWIELSLSTQKTEVAPSSLVTRIEREEDILNHTLWFISPLVLLHYDYPVHMISADNKPTETQATQLLVYRDSEDEIQFVTLNETTYLLLKRLIDDQETPHAALSDISKQLQQPTSSVLGFGLSFLNDFYQKGIIQGYLRAESNDH